MDHKKANPFIILLDLIESFLLLICFAMIRPLCFLKGFFAAYYKSICCIRIMLPYGLLSSYIRITVDLRLEKFGYVIANAECLIATLEEHFLSRQKRFSVVETIILSEIYSILARAHLFGGNIEDAALVVIRANRVLKVDRLPKLFDLDLRSAHIIKAGMAAGRLIEEGGAAAFFVHPGGARTEAVRKNKVARLKGPLNSGTKEKGGGSHPRAKVIPFPVSNPFRT